MPIHLQIMDWMLIGSSAAFFVLCALCAVAINRPVSEPAQK